jgi:predicted transcriptional regulator
MASTTIETPSFVAPSVLPSGDDLRRIRREQGLTVGQLARRARVHRATIHRVEADDPRASVRSRMLVAAALGIEIFPPLWREAS